MLQDRKKYAVIGHPISHSLSPVIHQAFSHQTGRPIAYTAIEAPLDDFEGTISRWREAGGKGCNVTVPFKTAAYRVATVCSELAQQAEAANTLCFNENHEIYAHSTDGMGLVRDLTQNYLYSMRAKKILILGAGGAVQCILGALLQEAPKILGVANRTFTKAQGLVEHFEKTLASKLGSNGVLRAFSLNALPGEPYDLIINATSASLKGDPLTLLDQCIGQDTWCYDLSYGALASPFLKWARSCGAKQCIDGLGMLVEQAAVSFYLWCDVYPQTQTVIKSLVKKRFTCSRE